MIDRPSGSTQLRALLTDLEQLTRATPGHPPLAADRTVAVDVGPGHLLDLNDDPSDGRRDRRLDRHNGHARASRSASASAYFTLVDEGLRLDRDLGFAFTLSNRSAPQRARHQRRRRMSADTVAVMSGSVSP